jgi:hypothetical protein
MTTSHSPYPGRAETRPFPGFVLSRVSRCGVAYLGREPVSAGSGRRVRSYASLSPLLAAAPVERRVSARRGWVGEKTAILNILRSLKARLAEAIIEVAHRLKMDSVNVGLHH